MADPEEILLRLAIHDDAYVDSVLSQGFRSTSASGLDPQTQAFARIAALAVAGAEPVAYMPAVEAGRAAGATPREIVGVLVALLPSIGPERVVAAAPRLGAALGFDVDGALERRSPGDDREGRLR